MAFGFATRLGRDPGLHWPPATLQDLQRDTVRRPLTMCRPEPPRAVIFDLDGTLVQTREASWRVFEKISAAHHLGIVDPEQFYEMFANNFFVSLRNLCRDAEHAHAVEADFMRSLGADYAPLLIPGMVDIVKALVPHATLAVLSSNSTEVIRRILRKNSLTYCFSHVFGGDVEPDKRKGIQRFLDDAAQGSGRRCQAFYDESAIGSPVPAQSTAIITDTVGDVEAAVKSGIRAIGVAWGMHTEEQLLTAGAEFVAIWPQEILAHLFGSSTATPACVCPAQPAIGLQTSEAVSAAPAARMQRRAAGAKAMQRRMTSHGALPHEHQQVQSMPGPAPSSHEPGGENELLLAVRLAMP
ncbi:HAD family hydrolase [Rhodococcus sp. JS3073]|uniref:HAD family hydrolase n=1 Tax=Rhodococcus sp. JS3073 TaxID=3002901 RepID=UPI002285CE45|nr:HAD family hydrolase [Rhodococcus sp. JS3073]WAM15317.1 HAD family hydrolase [Rhodococcus sp. JS3073]